MPKTKFMCFVLLTVLSLAACCPVGYSQAVLTLDDLPSSGESLVVSSDSVLTVNEGETAVIDGAVIQINGTEHALTEFKIINNGEFTIKNTQIRCNTANFTIQNMGTLNLKTVHFTVIGNSTLALDNQNNCEMSDTSIDVYGGYAHLSNSDSLTVNNGYFKDQFDGTLIANSGDALFSETTFVANGASGKIEIFTSGDLKLTHGVFDVNYGGTVNINSLTGTMTVNNCNMDISGWSHGKKSSVNILCGNSTWESCSLVNNAGTFNCLNTGVVHVSDCTASVSSINSSTILSNSGQMFFENFDLSGSGSASITNWDIMDLTDSSYASSHSLTLMNNGELTAENWFVKTTSSTARIVVYNGNNATLAFDAPFIENVDVSTLTSIGPEGHEFVESSGGIITVTNNNVITQKSSTNGDLDSSLLYILVIAAAVILVIIVLVMMKKKNQKPDAPNQEL
ncbi:MAG: hypothetical protein NWF06_11055 [Candidatus Bathyarchaeota archaeon]|nr:hypothetical protein [Candidatus Bathyarchaeum sp.]